MSESSFEDEVPQEKVVAVPSVSSEKLTETRSENGESSTNSDDRIVSKTQNVVVRRSKFCVLLVIGLAAIGFSLATYFFTDNSEKRDFESQ